MKLGKTANYHMIEDDHTCSSCYRTKYQVNFAVEQVKGRWYVKKRCNSCVNHNKHLSGNKYATRLCRTEMYDGKAVTKREEISLRIAAYFKEK